jgi:hypothetical protein
MSASLAHGKAREKNDRTAHRQDATGASGDPISVARSELSCAWSALTLPAVNATDERADALIARRDAPGSYRCFAEGRHVRGVS